ncbi:hypothetical protein M5689_012997 [Euphorbia peplus]|nr:hypothetical protein M5689_012997 [Euphorbia peplus]
MREKEEANGPLKNGYRFLLCLRPAVVENLGNGSRFKHLPMETFDDVLLSPPATHLKKKTTTKFLRRIKALLFQTSPQANKILKKAKKIKKKQRSNGDSPLLKMEKIVTATTLNKKFGKKQTREIISGNTSIETSATLLSSSSSMGFPDSNGITKNVILEQKQEKGKGCYDYGIHTGLCLALLVLVIWGKLFSILCTSFWLFFLFLPNWSQWNTTLLLLLKNRVQSDDKNKITIMEGED